MLYTGSIFAPPKPGSALRGMYYLAAWGALLFFRMPLGKKRGKMPFFVFIDTYRLVPGRGKP